MNSRNINILLGIIIFLLFGVIYFLVLNQGSKVAQAPLTPQDNAQTQNSDNTETVGKKEEISGNERLRTYANTKYGYTISLPESYDLPEPNAQYARFVSTEGVVEVNIKEAFVQVNDGTGKKIPVELKDYVYLETPIPTTKGILGGQAAIITHAPNGYCDGPGCTDPFIAYSANKPVALFYNVVFYGDAELSASEEKILQSFKFKYQD